MDNLNDIEGQIERALGQPLSVEQRAQIPALLSLLGSLGGLNVGTDEQHAQPRAFDARSSPTLVNLTNAQTGEVSFRDVADTIVHNTIILRTDPAHAAARFADGINTLQLIIQRTPAARDALVVFRDRLSAARLQVRALINLKTLHDLLHVVQHRTLPMMVRELRRFPDDERAVESIEQCELDLRDLHGQIEALLAQEYVTEQEVAWRSNLWRFADAIGAGRSARDQQQIDGAMRLAKSLINTSLSRINTNLYQKARDLRVEDLATPLRSLAERLIAFEVDRQQLARVEAGIAGLLELHRLLSALVFVHNGWQVLDDELNRIEPSLRIDNSDLALSWPFLHPRIEMLCQGAEIWAQDIRDNAGRLDQALAQLGTVQIRAAFDRLQNRISNRFFIIDTELKALCDQLRDFRDPLDSLGVGV